MQLPSREWVRNALMCLLDLASALESFVAVLVTNGAAQRADDHASSSDRVLDRLRLPTALVVLWIGLQYAAFGVSVTFAGAVWVARRRSRALVLLTNALFFALYGLQWLLLSGCGLHASDTNASTVFGLLAAPPLLGCVLSWSSGRQAQDDAERQEALDTVQGHEEEFLYHSVAV